MAKEKTTSKEAEGKAKNLENTLKEIQDKFGDGSIMMLSGARRVDVGAIPTGSVSLDLALGVGGVPRGRIIEIFGPESSGKTTLSLHIAAESQKMGGTVAFIDAEHALDPEYASKIGVKIEKLIISQPDTGEEALAIVDSLVRSGTIDLIIIDSVAALTPRAEIEGEMGQQFIGLQARLMSQALRKLTAVTAKSNTTIIFINQIRMQVGVFFGNPETTPGGKALKFYSSVRIDIRKTGTVKKGEEIVGSTVKVKVVKNKVAPPFRIAEFDILYNEGISYEGDLIITGQKYGIITKSGNTLSYDSVRLGVGMEQAREFLRTNPKAAKEIETAVKKAAVAPKAAAAVEVE